MRTWDKFVEGREEQIEKIRRIKNNLAYVMGVSEEELSEMPNMEVAKLIFSMDLAESPLEASQLAAMVKQFHTL